MTSSISLISSRGNPLSGVRRTSMQWHDSGPPGHGSFSLNRLSVDRFGETAMGQTDHLALALKSSMRPSRRKLLGGLSAGLLASASGSLLAATRVVAEGAGAPGRMTEAQRLAQFAADIAFDKLPASTVAAVKRLVLDTLGCALGAIDGEPAKIAEAIAPSIAPGERGATIIGSGRRTTASGAAFVNGTQVRFLDFLDVYFTKDVCHPSENIPPAMACVEEVGGSGATSSRRLSWATRLRRDCAMSSHSRRSICIPRVPPASSCRLSREKRGGRALRSWRTAACSAARVT
jgi:hypothetical protein